MTIIKYLFVTSLFFAGFVCGGALATKKYSDRLVGIFQYVDQVNAVSSELSDELMACKVTLDMGRKL